MLNHLEVVQNNSSFQRVNGNEVRLSRHQRHLDTFTGQRHATILRRGIVRGNQYLYYRWPLE